MMFADLVSVSDAVRQTDSRADKVAGLTAMFRDRSPDDVAACTELLLRARFFDGDDDAGHDREIGDDGSDVPTDPLLRCDHVALAILQIDRATTVVRRRDLVHQLLAGATVAERRWILEAVGRRQPDRLTFDLIASSAAAAARVTVGGLKRAASVAGSLPAAVRIALDRGESGLAEVEIEPGRPIPPTDLDTREPPTYPLDLPNAPIVEWRMRADRIQAHRRRGVVTVFDHRLDDVTTLVPTIVEQVATLPRGDLVLDGWAHIDRRSPTDPPSVAGLPALTSRSDHGRAVFFDVMFHGAPVLDEPLSMRLQRLATIVPEHWRLPSVHITDVDTLAAALLACRAAGHEGLIVRQLDTPYEGGLVRSSWRTVDAVHVAHLVVTGAKRGTGGRSSLLATVVLSAADEHGEQHEVGRTARGLSENMVARQTTAFAELAIAPSDIAASRVIALRPDVAAVVAIDGVDRDPATGRLTILRPCILGYRPAAETVTTSLADLDVIADQVERNHSGEIDRPMPNGPVTLLDPPQIPRLPPSAPAPPRSDDVWEVAPKPSAVSSLAADLRSESSPAGPSIVSSTDTTNRRRSIAGVDFEPYRDPVLPRMRTRRLGVVAARLAVLAWIVAMLSVALSTRTGDAGVDVAALGRVGQVGAIVAVVALSITGWAWTDRLVRTVRLLDGRKPTRLRCARAWLTPPLVALVASLLMAATQPTEPADVRPVFVIVVFGLVMWRPYALVRRILFSLTRLRSDALIASAYLIDVLAFGFLWWRLTLLDDAGSELSQGETDILVGTLAATVISMALGLLVWSGLVKAVSGAVTHRRSSQRTRYEHRMLRLQGVDPSDPEIWWALVRRHAEEQRALEQERSPEAPRTAMPTVDDLLESTRREHTIAFRRLDAEESTQLELRLRAEFATILGNVPLDQDEHQPVGDDRSATTVPVVRVVEPAVESEESPSVDRSAVARVGSPATAPTRPTEHADETDPIEALRRRANRRAAEPRDPSEIEVLLTRAGSLQVDAALAAHREREHDAGPGARRVPPRLFLVEAMRFITVAWFAAVTLIAGWLVFTSMSSDAAAGTTQLPNPVVGDLESGRMWFWSLFTVAGALVPAWAGRIERLAGRAGLAGSRERRLDILTLIAVAASGAGFVMDRDERGLITLVSAAVIVWSAVSAGLTVDRARAWLDLPASTLTAYVSTLPVVLGLAWLAGLVGPVDPSASLQRLAFTTILLTLGCARVTVMFALSSLDLEDALRASPALSVTARSGSHR